MRRSIVAALSMSALPSAGWASCTYADGTPAPKPGVASKAGKSAAWATKFVELFGSLSRGDKSTINAALNVEGAQVLVTRCTPHDLFWTHLSLLGLSGVVDAKLPDTIAQLTRAYQLTSKGQKVLPSNSAMTQ